MTMVMMMMIMMIIAYIAYCVFEQHKQRRDLAIAQCLNTAAIYRNTSKDAASQRSASGVNESRELAKQRRRKILTNDMMAARSRIFTRRSSNCSRTSSHSDLPITATV